MKAHCHSKSLLFSFQNIFELWKKGKQEKKSQDISLYDYYMIYFRRSYTEKIYNTPIERSLVMSIAVRDIWIATWYSEETKSWRNEKIWIHIPHLLNSTSPLNSSPPLKLFAPIRFEKYKRMKKVVHFTFRFSFEVLEFMSSLFYQRHLHCISFTLDSDCFLWFWNIMFN